MTTCWEKLEQEQRLFESTLIGFCRRVKHVLLLANDFIDFTAKTTAYAIADKISR